LINEARKTAESGFSDRVHIRKVTYDGGWQHMGTREGRSLDSVILRGGLKNKITNDIDWFLQNKSWYNQRGIPYRRSYLFYGPPGNGKTSLVLALATKFDLDVCVVTLVDMTDDDLLSAFSYTNPGDLLLIEDVDALFKSRTVDTSSPYEKQSAPATFSGMLNALDGITSAEGHIIVMTTNFKNRLDPALLRPGRVDMEVEFGNAIPKQAAAIYRRFYPGVDDVLVNEFVSRVPSSSMAAIQGHLIQYPTSPEEAAYFAPSIRITNEPTATQKS
jgi:chaperone BCS1